MQILITLQRRLFSMCQYRHGSGLIRSPRKRLGDASSLLPPLWSSRLPRAASHRQHLHPSRSLHQGALCKPTFTDNWHRLLCVILMSLWVASFALHHFSVAAIT
jgi:hypothetical protein